VEDQLRSWIRCNILQDAFRRFQRSDDLLNGPILCCSSIIDVVVSSAAESEDAAAYPNAKDATHIRDMLESLGYPQGATRIISDNSFVCNLVNGECKAKESRSMDIRFFG
jgi:hypothetical protein